MRVIEQNDKAVTVVTDNGTRLDCVPVRQLPVQDLVGKIGLTDQLTSMTKEQIQTTLATGGVSKQFEVARASMALFNYCMAYGVTTDPPAEAIEELQALGLAPTNPRALRATWLNYLVLKDADEAGVLTSVILALTFGRVKG
jgi:hypothetical protein